MHIGHNNVQGKYDISNQQLRTTDQQQDLGIITKDSSGKHREELQNGRLSTLVHCLQF